MINEGLAWIECGDCQSNAVVGPFNTDAEAVTAWNTRVGQARYRAELLAEIVAWLRADESGRGLVGYRDCWNIAAMLERGGWQPLPPPPTE